MLHTMLLPIQILLNLNLCLKKSLKTLKLFHFTGCLTYEMFSHIPLITATSAALLYLL